MSIELPEINQSIDLKHRLDLEVALMDKMIGENASQDEQIRWIDTYSDLIRQIIFKEENVEIRELALAGQYKESADLILRELNNNSDSEISRAA